MKHVNDAADDVWKNRMTTWKNFNRFPGSDSFYGCVAPDGTWFDSALLFTNAVHHCCQHAGQFDLSVRRELRWMDESDLTHGYSVIHSSLLEKMFEKGLLK